MPFINDTGYSGLQQFGREKVERTQENKQDIVFNVVPSAGRQTAKPDLHQSIPIKSFKNEEPQKEKELTQKDNVEVAKNEADNEAFVLDTGKEIYGRKILTKEQKTEAKKIHEEFKKVSIYGSGSGINNGHGLYGRGGFSKRDYVNAQIGQTVGKF